MTIPNQNFIINIFIIFNSFYYLILIESKFGPRINSQNISKSYQINLCFYLHHILEVAITNINLNMRIKTCQYNTWLIF